VTPVRLVFAFGNITSFRLQSALATRLAPRGRAISFLYWADRDAVFDRVLTEAAGNGAVAALGDFSDSAGEIALSPAPRLRQRLIRLATPLPIMAEALRKYGTLHRTALTRATAALRRLEPSVLIVSEDGISSNLHLMAAARHLGIPVLDVPYGNAVREEFDTDLERKSRSGDLKRAEGVERWLLRATAPQWLKTGSFADALMFPPDYTLAAEYFGVTLRDAWIVHGGFAERLCVENAIGLARYRREGIPVAKMIFTGSPYCDEVVAAIADDPAARAAFRRPVRIETGRVRALVSWPPSFHDQRGGLSEFASYEEMTRTVLGFLHNLPGLRLTVSLHPAVSDGIRTMLAADGIPVSDDHVVGLIPRHDVFLTYFSSTIRWAIAAGKPVVNYDAYRLGLDIYDGAPGYVNATSFAALRDLMTPLTRAPGRFEQMADAQCGVAPDWGLMDGRCSERIDEAIVKLAGRDTKR
jgi:hypothetical protein